MSDVRLFRKKPDVVQAMQFTDESKEKVFSWMYYDSSIRLEPLYEDDNPVLEIKTLGDVTRAVVGDYIIKDATEGFYLCKPDIFERTYEEITDNWDEPHDNQLSLWDYEEEGKQ